MTTARPTPVRDAPGDFFVDERCIGCGSCRWIAPQSFAANGRPSYVHRQPQTPAQLEAALRARLCCPTASIGDRGRHPTTAIVAELPRPIADGILHCGYHSRSSFGAASYLVLHPEGNVLVDLPRFTRPLLRRLEALGGIDTIVLTHEDAVVDHARFAAHFGARRVLHAADVDARTRDVERVIEGDQPAALAEDLLLIPTPGHTPGSLCLLHHGRTLLTGDHLAFSPRLGHLYAFASTCWHDWPTQIRSMRRLLAYDFERVLPGHGAPVHATAPQLRAQLHRCIAWMEQQTPAIHEPLSPPPSP